MRIRYFTDSEKYHYPKRSKPLSVHHEEFFVRWLVTKKRKSIATSMLCL